VIELIGRLVRRSQRHRREAGRGATAAELAVALELPPLDVERTLKVARGMVSLEQPDEPRAPVVPEAPADGLTAREERVLCMRFGIRLEADPALERLGRQLLQTRKRVRQIERKNAIEPDEPTSS
jgi:RNA polymerase primary sigma factor